MAKNAHLTLSEHITIETCLRDAMSFKQIAREVGKDPSTISKEVRGHFKVIEKDTYNPCRHRRECKHFSDICSSCKHQFGKFCRQCSKVKRFTVCADFEEILTDRGSEFTDPVSLECDEWGEVRTRIFYCDPQRSDQKGGIEVTHEFIRRILLKGASFNHLTQDDISLMMSHINSYTRKKLNNRSAHQLFSFFYGDDILDRLDIHQIPANDINLTPKLLKK